MTITEYVARHIAMKRKLGYQFTTNARILLSFARFADDRGEAFIRAEIVLQWALESASQASAPENFIPPMHLPSGCMLRTRATRCRLEMRSEHSPTGGHGRIQCRSRTFGSSCLVRMPCHPQAPSIPGPGITCSASWLRPACASAKPLH